MSDARFRSAHDWARGQGYLSGFPNFHEADYGAGVVHGTMLIQHGKAEFSDVPRAEYKVNDIANVPAMMRAAASLAVARGYRAGMPTFHQANPGGAGVVYGTYLFRDSVDWRDVQRSTLGNPKIDDVGAMMRAANDYAVGAGYAGGFPTFHQADHGAGVVYGIVLLKPGTCVHRDRPMTGPKEGALLRERSHPPVWLIRKGQRLHVPNPYVMGALELSFSSVKEVPDGALDHIPIDHQWTPLGGRTPGSTVFMPYDPTHYPLPLTTSKPHRAWKRTANVIELRGWLQYAGGGNAEDPDMHFYLKLDARWALQRGIDLNALVKLGNVLQVGEHPDPDVNFRAVCSTPRINIELSGLPPKHQRDRLPPPDWTFVDPSFRMDTPKEPQFHDKPAVWPFDPRKLFPGDPSEFPEYRYVRMVGSVVSDKPHVDPTPDDPREDARRAVVRLWQPFWQWGHSNNEHSPARYTEIHPPDWVEVIAPPPPQDAETFRGVAVIAPGTYTWQSAISTTLDARIPAPPRPGPEYRLTYREYVGNETNYDTIKEGNSTLTGARVTVNEDSIDVHVRVRGYKDVGGGGPGKFKALYRVFWVRGPSSGPFTVPPGPPKGPGPHRIMFVSSTHGRRIGRITAVAGVNADHSPWRLSVAQVISMIESGTQFHVEENGRRARVKVASLFGRKHIKTTADTIRVNNLLRLSRF